MTMWFKISDEKLACFVAFWYVNRCTAYSLHYFNWFFKKPSCDVGMYFGKLHYNLVSIGNDKKNFECPPETSTTANGMHQPFFGRYPKCFDNFRSFPIFTDFSISLLNSISLKISGRFWPTWQLQLVYTTVVYQHFVHCICPVTADLIVRQVLKTSKITKQSLFMLFNYYITTTRKSTTTANNEHL